MPTYYEILGVDAQASPEEIQAAYDARMKQCYADLRDPEKHNASIEQIKQLKLAHDNLVEGEQRKRYDAAAKEEETRRSEPPNPWRRFVARFFDQLLAFVLLYPLYRYFADYVFFEDWIFTLEAVGAGILLYFLLETAVLSIFRSTPGKWMLSIRLTAADGGNPKRPRLASRNLMSAAMGLALDIPPFSLLAMALSFRDLYKEKSRTLSLWDRACGTAVSYGPFKRVRLVMILPVLVLFLVELIDML